MIYILHYLQDPKLWKLYGTFLVLGNAGFISSTVIIVLPKPRALHPESRKIMDVRMSQAEGTLNPFQQMKPKLRRFR